MPIPFSLKDKKKAKTSIEASGQIFGKRYKMATGQSVITEHWDFKKQRAKYKNANPDGKNINDGLKEFAERFEKAVAYFTKNKIQPTPLEFRKRVQEGIEPNTPDMDFIPYLQNFIDTTSYSYETKKKYITALNKLTAWQKETGQILRFSNIDIHFYRKFEKWFYTLLNDKTEQHYSANYHGSIVKVIKKMMNQARSDKLTNADGDKHKDFKIPNETAETIYLTVDELTKIHSLEITPDKIKEFYPKLRAQNVARKIDSYNFVKDIFLIGAFTALRVGDFNRLEDIHFSNGRIKVTTSKTGKQVVIPVHPIVKEIINKGFDFNRNISEQKLNKHIKNICKIAGLTEKVETTRTHANKKVKTVSEKWKW